MKELQAIWDDQARFNVKFREFPVRYEDKCDQTRDLVLEMTDELHELLRTTVWKKHRNGLRLHPNMAHTQEELVDTFKYFVSLCQVWGIGPEVLLESYWRKSAVCEQRYVEEWVSEYAKGHPLARVAFVDLDNVIFDFIRSFGAYVLSHHRTEGAVRDRVTELVEKRHWLSAESTGIPVEQWEYMKHQYRVTGGKAFMSLMPGAKEFLQALKATEHVIVVVTSRPIDRYPNLMTDTVMSLKRNGLPFDHVWHGPSKKTALVERLTTMPTCAFAVDDDPRYVQEYVSMGLSVYHVTNGANVPVVPGSEQVSTLNEIVAELGLLA